jgi:cell division protein ftsZ
VDFRILCDFLSHGGVSFHSVGYARGPGRVTRAIEDALRSPLVADYDINQAKSVLVHIQCGSQGDDGDDENMLTLDEYTELDRFFDSFFNSSFNEINYFRGLAIDDTLGEYVCISLFAGGFALENISGMRTHLDAAADAREQQRAREEELRERRRAEFYGLNESSPLPRRQHAVYIFQPDDLDNPEVIRMVEASPTGRRTTELHAQIVRQSLTPPPTSTSDSEQTQHHV